MRNKNNKHLGIEIDPILHYKLSYIAKYEGRSVNRQILYLVITNHMCINMMFFMV